MTLRDLWRGFLRRIPGTRLHRAARKRQLEDALRAEGVSGAKATRIAARVFARRGA